jgi:hypothetical protein
MPKLKDAVGRLWRKVTRDHKHMTLDGINVLTKFTCVVCKKEGFVSETYLKSSRDRKNDNDIRPYHATCYNLRNGKYLKDKEKSNSSLSDFLKD